MTLITQNVGQVAALFSGTTPPINTAMLWYNTNVGIFIHYYYNTQTSAWVPLNQSSSGGAIIEKAAVIVATTGLESAVTYNTSSKTITVNAAEGPVTIDKVVLTINQRVLWGGDGVGDIKAGIYTVTTVGDNSTPWVLTRSSDSNTSSNISSGEMVPVLNGVINQGITFILTTDVPFSLNTSLLQYTAFSVFYTRSNPTTITVGGLNAGSMVSGPIQSTLDKILFPYQLPDFSSFEISGQNPSLEVGQKVNGGAGLATFIWTTNNSSNINTNSLSIIDVTGGNTVLGSAIANTGSDAVSILAISKNVTGQTYQFKIEGVNSQTTTFFQLLTLTWLTRRCFFISAIDYITPSGNDSVISTALNALTVTTQYELSAIRQMTKNLSPTSHYIYFVWLDSLGGDNTIFTVNGLPNTSWVYKTFSYTNSYGVVLNFRIFRSQNILSTNFNVTIN